MGALKTRHYHPKIMKKINHPISKRYREAAKLIDQKKKYSLVEAIELVKKTSTVKFDAGVEAHIRLSIDPKKGDQQIRNSVILPHGTGKTKKVAILTNNPEKQKQARAAGADLVGEKDLIDEIKSGKINFDILIATPEMMKSLAPAAKILGPKGLMPNPKDGTVTANIVEALASFKKGKTGYKNDDSGNVHLLIGKTSFTNEQLQENFTTFLENLKKAKPAGVKGTYIQNISLASSMGPGVKVEMI